MKTEKCAYCGKSIPMDEQAAPDLRDDSGWAELAEKHKTDCEWIITRAHRTY